MCSEGPFVRAVYIEVLCVCPVTSVLCPVGVGKRYSVARVELSGVLRQDIQSSEIECP